MDQITERFDQIYPVLQEILTKHQDQLKAVKSERVELKQKIDEKEKEILLSKIAYISSLVFKIELNSFALLIYYLINLKNLIIDKNKYRNY